MILHEKETEDILLSITRNCETFNKQTHTKPKETPELELNKSKETFSFEPPFILGLDSNWLIGLTSLEVFNSIFNITERNNKFKLYTDTFDEFSFAELKDELEKVLVISNITHEHLQDKILGPRNIKAVTVLETEQRWTDGYYMVLMGYARSLFRDFETYLRTVVGLEENDIQLI